jgi:hypothetical protein
MARHFDARSHHFGLADPMQGASARRNLSRRAIKVSRGFVSTSDRAAIAKLAPAGFQ